MGLDVNLYKKEANWDKWNAIEKKAEDLSEEIWDIEMTKLGKKNWNELTKEEQDMISNLVDIEYEKLGLDEWGNANEKKETEIDIPSKKYPKHLFKIGYFRSSYNENGFNIVMQNLIGKDLYWIFEPLEGEFYVKPDWKRAKLRALDFMFELTDKVEKFPYGCFYVFHYETKIKNEREALTLFKEKMEENSPFGCFSSSNGYFSLKESINVRAIIPGLGWTEEPSTYIIYEKDYSSYLSSIEIVIETIDYVLEQPDPENYILHWSS